MNWLVTVTKNADLKKIRSIIESVGGEMDPNLTLDLTVGEDVVIAVTGPENFSEVLKKATKDVLGVYPNSDVTLY